MGTNLDTSLARTLARDEKTATGPVDSNSLAEDGTIHTELALPSDTLYFPRSTSSFLDAYLPSYASTISSTDLFPYITLTYATSLDSQLSLSPSIPTPISGPATKAMTHYLRSCHDVILIGVGTAVADDPTLNCRLEGAGGYGGLGLDLHPRPVIVDPSARWRVDEEAELEARQKKILNAVKQGKGKAPWVIVEAGIQIEESRVAALQAIGGDYLFLGDMDNKSRLRWDSIFRLLAKEGIRSVMVEGGGIVIDDLLSLEYTGLVGSVVITVAPTYLGSGGVRVCPNRKVDADGRIVPAIRFRDVKWQPLGEDVVMCGKLQRG